ncbi:unnamed protein product [Phytophthora fragariaefolia]|uniref:Unnamed protein product n=1 Tax=Phytophthora fragariaefolia TaxID=1490495 RepID=A0A9W6WRE7_9STRA|nr:unnamed protein product [Phytophthora fragariaefolia]
MNDQDVAVAGARLTEDEEAAQVRLVQQQATTDGAYSVLAEDGLPTATNDVEGERLPMKLGSSARYSVAGTGWMLRGERSRRPAPADVIEGIGGFMLDVIGVWTFYMRNVAKRVSSGPWCRANQ